MLKAEFLPLSFFRSRQYLPAFGLALWPLCSKSTARAPRFYQPTSHNATRAQGRRQHARSFFHIGNPSTGLASATCQQNNRLLPKDCGDTPLRLWNMIVDPSVWAFARLHLDYLKQQFGGNSPLHPTHPRS